MTYCEWDDKKLVNWLSFFLRSVVHGPWLFDRKHSINTLALVREWGLIYGVMLLH